MKLEVFGVIGKHKSSAKVSHVVAGKKVTSAVVRGIKDEHDVKIAFNRAVAADNYNVNILRQFELFQSLHKKHDYVTLNLDTNCVDCILCAGGILCAFCQLKQKYREELYSLKGGIYSLKEIKQFLLDDITMKSHEKKNVEHK
mmetsp:Transcript_15087/g.14568  ORF Transcript_15087/g.14568 Transcript_15087/m.14568 type:complete len:143 (-) Transcript_15087:52-480(-)